jgi:Flp pilus assembly protein TadG
VTAIKKALGRKIDPAVKKAREQSCAHGEEGSAILETALSLIILLTFLFGIMETGYALFSYHFISHAAREGARFAIVRGSSAGSACTAPGPPTCAARPIDIQNYVTTLGFSAITASDVSVTYATFPTPGGTCTPSTTCNNPGNLVTVTVTYNFPFVVPFVPARTFAMSSRSAMIISQ